MAMHNSGERLIAHTYAAETIYSEPNIRMGLPKSALLLAELRRCGVVGKLQLLILYLGDLRQAVQPLYVLLS